MFYWIKVRAVGYSVHSVWAPHSEGAMWGIRYSLSILFNSHNGRGNGWEPCWAAVRANYSPFTLGLGRRRSPTCLGSFGPKKFGLPDRGLSVHLPVANQFHLLYLIVWRGMPVSLWTCFGPSTPCSKNPKIILCQTIFFFEKFEQPHLFKHFVWKYNYGI